MAPDAPHAHQQIAPGPDGAPVALKRRDRRRRRPKIRTSPIRRSSLIRTSKASTMSRRMCGPELRHAAAGGGERVQSDHAAQNPAAFQVLGDFWAENSDFPGADELADRLKRGLPPQYRAGPDPQVAAVTQQAQQMQQQAQGLLQKADAQIASRCRRKSCISKSC